MQVDEEYQWLLLEVNRKEKEFLFLVAERALRDLLVEILWLDIHEQCTCENRLDLRKKLQFMSCIQDGASL